MESIKLDYSKVLSFVGEKEISAQQEKAIKALKSLKNGTCKGSDFLGWLDLPVQITENELERISSCTDRLREQTDVVVIIGIGGSYLGAKAVIEAMSGSFDVYSGTRVVFAGNNVSEDYLYELQAFLKDKKFGICVISKSGTTTEPAVAFRLLKDQLIEQEGVAVSRERIVAITDEKKGALRAMADKEEYETFVIPDNVGGRYSVLTPVGLLPVALAGLDIRSLVKGAVDMWSCMKESDAKLAVTYASVRNALYEKGYVIEITVNFNPKLHYVAEWWKQLYGESEGKESKGIFPASVDFTTDLHSMGQYIQEGRRNLFETVLSIEKTKYRVQVPCDAHDLDKLNYLAGKRVDEVNKMAELGTQLAHVEGGVPNMRVIIPELTEYYLGQLFYFYEMACAISGGILGVNAFDQPGVEAYKNNMFMLLGKPGYEKRS
ncbi:glucose-6-phosphate isomerase [Odoribacter sp. AF15-53]|uniref:glucose-6-phosphate isomerase n=1 Tax=Odoribacter sp. AF15-53 TaxID=2292236 RepID=UPI000E545C33|nr:glucose-6-phosphate isomerase [Odoribacter sp. AF15-53]RHR82704.1 glucose-6-phosphate isomerase [Odoribacter sp. AF15-53]